VTARCTETVRNQTAFAAFFRAYFAFCRQAFEQYTALAIPEKRFSHTGQKCHEVCRRADSAAPSLALSIASLYAPGVTVSNIVLDTVAYLWEDDSMKRGTIKSFREYLNAKFRFDLANWRNNQFRQVSREYGDYLYHQDREMFNVCLEDALAGKGDYADWKRP